MIMNNKEIFKLIPGYEDFYQVSNFGNVKSLSRDVIRKHTSSFISKEKILKPSTDKSGYLQVNLFKNGVKIYKVHTLVAMAFLNHKPLGYKLVVDHINEIKTDNRAENLQLLTTRSNVSKSKLGNYSSKYTGVCWVKSNKKWKAQIRINKDKKFLGYFEDEYQAHLVYEKELKSLIAQ